MKTFLLSIIFSLSSIGLSQSDSLKTPLMDSLSELEVHVICEEMPEYPGGETEMIKYLIQNLQFEELNIDDIISTVYLEFIVDKNGIVRNAKALRSPDHPIAQKCVQLVSEMPLWKPGKQNGELINVKYTIPIRIHPK